MAKLADYPHLNKDGKALVRAPDEDRIRSIRAGTWLGYEQAKENVENAGAIGPRGSGHALQHF